MNTDGPTGDPDNDGQTNAQELAAGTHPNNVATLSRYLAEGSSNTFFETTIGVANPGTQPATVVLRFLRADGVTVSRTLTLPAREHVSVRPAQLSGLPFSDYSTIVETDREVVVERTMIWSTTGRFGSHSERAVNAPSTTWFFAEGATHGAFDTFYLLENPTGTAANVEIVYLLPNGVPPILGGVTVQPFSRTTIPVDLQPGLAETDVSARLTVTNGVGIIAERAMYRTSHGTPFNAGHDSARRHRPAEHQLVLRGRRDRRLLRHVPAARQSDGLAEQRHRALSAAGRRGADRQEDLSADAAEPHDDHGGSRGCGAAERRDRDGGGSHLADRRRTRDVLAWPVGIRLARGAQLAGDDRNRHGLGGRGRRDGRPERGADVRAGRQQSTFAGSARITVLREGAAPLVKVIDLLPNSRNNVNIGDYPSSRRWPTAASAC